MFRPVFLLLTEIMIFLGCILLLSTIVVCKTVLVQLITTTTVADRMARAKTMKLTVLYEDVKQIIYRTVVCVEYQNRTNS